MFRDRDDRNGPGQQLYDRRVTAILKLGRPRRPVSARRNAQFPDSRRAGARGAHVRGAHAMPIGVVRSANTGPGISSRSGAGARGSFVSAMSGRCPPFVVAGPRAPSCACNKLIDKKLLAARPPFRVRHAGTRSVMDPAGACDHPGQRLMAGCDGSGPVLPPPFRSGRREPACRQRHPSLGRSCSGSTARR